MSDWTLTKTRLSQGIWEGVLSRDTSAAESPTIRVTYLDEPVAGVEVKEDAESGQWILRVPIPTDAIADGVQTLLILDAKDGAPLDKITILAGEALADDIRAEMGLLRAELDMLKRAFRRHCVETM